MIIVKPLNVPAGFIIQNTAFAGFRVERRGDSAVIQDAGELQVAAIDDYLKTKDVCARLFREIERDGKDLVIDQSAFGGRVH